MTTEENRTCSGCGAEPGERHRVWDDIARCRISGIQLIQCGDEWDYDEEGNVEILNKCGHECEPDIWDGEWPGVKECRELGWYTDPDSIWGETEDLNRLYQLGKWNPRTEKLEVPTSLINNTNYINR